MDELAKTHVLYPYSTPERTRNVSNTTLPIKDTIRTLFFDIDPKTQYIQNPKEFESMLDNAKNAIPKKIVKLSCNDLPYGFKPNQYSQNVPLWISAFADLSVPFFLLYPPPQFDLFPLNEFLRTCIENAIAPDRAAEGISIYCSQQNITPEILTDELISNPKYSSQNPDYFAKLGYALYIRNLVIPTKFIIWLITQKIFEPRNIKIFKDEIIQTHSLLYYALNSINSDKYINDIQNELLLTKSQIIQFSIISRVYQENSFQEYFDAFLKMRPDLKHRVIQVCNILLSQLAFSSMFRNLLFYRYPYFDIDYFQTNIERMITLSEDDQMTSNLLIMCKSVLWFDQNLISVSSIVAYMIKSCLDIVNHKQKEKDCKIYLKKDDLKFPLKEFIDLLYENIDKINKFVFLFAELQYHEIFHYSEFLELIYSKRGLFISMPEETKIIFSSLPWSSSCKMDLKMVNSALLKSFPGIDIPKDFIAYLTSPDVYLKVDEILKLPFSLRYQIAINLVRQTREFSRPAEFVLKIGAPNLIIPLFENASKNNSIELTLNVQALIQDMIPCFSCHNSLKLLVEYLISQPNHPICNEIVDFILTHYKKCSEITQKSNSFERQLNEISKSMNADPKLIYREHINSLFYDFSYYCSLHVFDAFFAVRTIKDFQNVMSTFFKDLLSFSMLEYEGLMRFFIEFSQSKCIKRPSFEFIEIMLDVLITNNEFENNERLHFILNQFFSEILRMKLFRPSFFFDTIFAGVKKNKGKQQTMALILIHILIKIIDKSADIFSIRMILTNSVVKNFMKLFPQENNPIIELLSVLRSYPPQIITEDMIQCSETNKTTGITYSSAIFSLLPDPMMSDDFVDVSEFFKSNVNRSTSTFWTLWLKWRPFYKPGFPVLAIQPNDEDIQSYRQNLISTFLSLLYHSKENEEQTLIYLNCWTLLCADLTFSKMIIQNTLDQLNSNNFPLSNKLITFLNPALVLSDINVELFKSLCVGISNYRYDPNQFEQFVKFGSCIFAIFVSKFPQETEIIPMIANKVIEWIPLLVNQGSSELESTIDIFNFIICFTNDVSINPNRNPINDDPEDTILQKLIHDRIKDNMNLIPKSIRKYILVNIPPQTVRIEQSLFSNFKYEEEEEQPPHEPASLPDHTDTVNPFQFEQSLFPFYNDEDPGNADIWGGFF